MEGNGLKLQEETKLQEDNFSPRVNFARITVLLEESFLHENK